jgi:hypothetical protein
MVNISMIVLFCCIIFCFQGEQTYVYKKNYRTVWNWAKFQILRPVKIFEMTFLLVEMTTKGMLMLLFILLQHKFVQINKWGC